MTAIIVAQGEFTTEGGDASETIIEAEAKTTDFVIVMLQTEGATPTTVDAANITTDGQIAVTMAGDPSTDHVLTYMVIRIVL